MFAGKMRKRKRPFVPADKQDTRKLTAEEREKLRRKAVLLYKRENPVPAIARKLGIRPATVYRWINNYLNEGPVKYRENKRGRYPIPNKYTQKPWNEFVKELREYWATQEKKKPGVPENILLYRGKEFFEWCSGLTEGPRYVYYCQIRRKLDELKIRENDSVTLQDRDFLRRQYYDPGHHQTGWMKYCMFLLGRPFKSNSRNIWFKGI